MTDLIPKHGGYRKLKTFQISQLIYDVTVRFCELYIERFSRTKDQMVQAARSGVQNIAEGSEVSATSKKMELKLTQVAREHRISMDEHGQALTGLPLSSSCLAANAALSLLNIACYLLDRQVERLARDFEKDGGFTEKLYRIRSSRRGL